MKQGQIKQAKENFSPLYFKGDKFKIIKINNDINLMSIEAMRLKNRKIYGFEVDELK